MIDDEKLGRSFLFSLIDLDSRKSNNELTSLVTSVNFIDKNIVLSFLMHPYMFTWLDTYNNQTNNFIIDLLTRKGEILQRLNFEGVQLSQDSINFLVEHRAGPKILEVSVNLHYKQYTFTPVEPHKDMRYLFKEFNNHE